MLCKLGGLMDDLICHAFVECADDRRLRDKVLMKACEGELKLARGHKIAQEYATATAHMK